MQPIRVLVVDDEKDFASAIVERLTLRGFQASAVYSGQDALQSVTGAEYDAVVLDLKMPGIDGLQTLEAVRQIDPDVQVLVLTGHATVSAGIGGMQLGAADFLRKPVTIGTLSRSIEAAAERTRACRESKQQQSKKERKP